MKIVNLLGESFSFCSVHFVFVCVTKINYIQLEKGDNFLSIDKKIFLSERVYRRDIEVDILYHFFK